jgi:hypothetical protein
MSDIAESLVHRFKFTSPACEPKRHGLLPADQVHEKSTDDTALDTEGLADA